MISKLTAPILNWFDRHANPIALQEVRHILSLTRTMIVYGLLVFGLWISSCNSSGYSADSLPFFMIGAFGVVGVALFPAQTLFVNSTRWSVDKMEMLHLTELRPMDIVMGRVLAGFSVLLIFGSLLLPFLALTYLLPGTQIGVVLVGFAMVILMALLANVFTLNVAWQMETYSFSSLIKVFWLLVLFQASFGPVGLMTAMMETGSAWVEHFWKVVSWVLIGWAIVMYYGVARSVVLLRHPESNRSTPIRIGVLLMALMGWSAIIAVHTVEREMIFGGTAIGLFLVGLVCLGFVIEHSNPGRKTLVELPKRKWIRWVLFPFLPTSGTGVLFTGLLLFGTAAVGETMLYIEDPISERWVGVPSYIGACLFGYICLILPRFSDSPTLYTQSRKRLVLMLYAPLTFIPFLLFAFIAQSDDPFKVFFTYIVPFMAFEDKSISMDGLVWACVVVSLTLAVNLSTILKSRKVLIHSTLEQLEAPSSSNQ